MRNSLYHIDLSDIERAIFLGLRKYGRNRTFSQMLEEASLFADGTERVEVAFTLEASGYIQAVTYQLPVRIRAELSNTGKKIADALEDERRLAKHGIPPTSIH